MSESQNRLEFPFPIWDCMKWPWLIACKGVWLSGPQQRVWSKIEWIDNQKLVIPCSPEKLSGMPSVNNTIFIFIMSIHFQFSLQVSVPDVERLNIQNQLSLLFLRLTCTTHNKCMCTWPSNSSQQPYTHNPGNLSCLYPNLDRSRGFLDLQNRDSRLLKAIRVTLERAN